MFLIVGRFRRCYLFGWLPDLSKRTRGIHIVVGCGAGDVVLEDAIQEYYLRFRVSGCHFVHITRLGIATDGFSQNAKRIYHFVSVPDMVFSEEQAHGIGEYLGQFFLLIEITEDGNCQ